MLQFIWFEIKRNLKRKEVIFLTLILVLCEGALLMQCNTNSHYEDVFSLQEKRQNLFYNNYPIIDKEKNEEIDQKVLQLNKTFAEYTSQKRKHQWKEMLTSLLDMYIFEEEMSYYSLPKEYRDSLPNVEEVKDIVKKMDLFDGSKYEPYMLQLDWMGEYYTKLSYHAEALKMRYLYSIYDQDIGVLSYSSVNSSTLLIQLMRSVLAVVLPLLVAILFFDDHKYYHEIGVDKSMMVIPKVRRTFIISKIIANSALVLFVVFVPILLMVCILGIFDHFQYHSYPTVVNEGGIIGTAVSYVRDGGYLLRDSEELYLGVTRMSENMFSNPNIDLIPMWAVNVLGMAMIIFLIIFYVQINLFCTRLFKNSYVALLCNLLIIAVLVYYAPVESIDALRCLNPMIYKDPFLNIMGTSYYPWLTGMLVIGGYNILLYIANRILFRFKYYG